MFFRFPLRIYYAVEGFVSFDQLLFLSIYRSIDLLVYRWFFIFLFAFIVLREASSTFFFTAPLFTVSFLLGESVFWVEFEFLKYFASTFLG